MFRRLLTYILVAVVMAACSDMPDIRPVDPVSPDGEVTVTLSVPAAVTMTSRTIEVDPEFQVDNVDVFIYDGDDDALPAQHVTASLTATGVPRLEQLTATELKLSFKLDNDLRGTEDLRFYFVANSAEALAGTKTVNELKNNVPALVNDSEHFTMSGSALYSEIVAGSKVSLYRNAAKATVSTTVPAVGESTAYHPLEIFGAASSSSLIAGLLGTNSRAEDVEPYPEAIDEPLKVSFHATENSEANDEIGGKLFVITKIAFNGTEYYYRLDFAKKDEAGSLQYISTLPNHWYQFVVTEVTAAGYDKPAEAALHPENGVKYEIHDHCMEPYNMTSDGYRELGVSHTIEYASDEGSSGEDKYLYIKLFSPNESELPATDDEVKDLVTVAEPSWLELDDPEIVSDEGVIGVEGAADDHNDRGCVYRMKLNFQPTTEIGTIYNTITVRWMGLEREVSVVWVRKFSGEKVSSAKLSMEYGATTVVIDDYWTFLTSTDDPEALAYPVGNLWGIQPELNNGKIRNQGFHFPVMYGTGSNLATYSYNLIFDKEESLATRNVTDVKVTCTDPNVTATRNADADGSFSYTVKRNNDDRYNYSVGDITFTFTLQDGSKEAYSFKTYHTGFFHKGNEDLKKYQLDGPKDYDDYFYYEVIPVNVDGANRYILDRNLSAKSAQDYVRDADGSTVVGNPDAAGGYYIVARQVEYYADPEMIAGIAPPGYDIPTKGIWDAIRLSTSFHSETTGSYYQAYYDTGNPLTGRVYFPKSMFYRIDNGGITGESRSGYYWTRTPATGTEKEEIGRWLQMFVLTGSSTTFNSGYVLNIDSQTNLAYACSVRCVNQLDEELEVYRTHFNVSGATHVFLYVDDEMHTSTTAWPGHPIGNYATMAPGNDNWFGFTYSSTQFRPDNLYVIFNFVDEYGIIHSYSCKDGSTIKTTDLSPNDMTGWKVTGGSYDAIDAGSNYTIDGKTLSPTPVTALGNWWRCGGDRDAPFVYNYFTDPSQRTVFR